jgi:hypothetical protein
MCFRRRPDPYLVVLNRIEKLVMTVNTDAQHLSDDVAAIGTAVGTAVAELKAQIAALVASGTPVALDFTALDALVKSTQDEAAADAPAAPVTPAP